MRTACAEANLILKNTNVENEGEKKRYAGDRQCKRYLRVRDFNAISSRQPNEIKKKGTDTFSSLSTTLCEINCESVRCDKSANERKRNCFVAATSNKTLSAKLI